MKRHAITEEGNEDVWIVIGNDKNGGPKVYDVTNYLDDHPGGKEVMTDLAGKNADELFEDIGHSKEARKIMQKYLKGEPFLTVSRHTFINFDINIFIYRSTFVHRKKKRKQWQLKLLKMQQMVA